MTTKKPNSYQKLKLKIAEQAEELHEIKENLRLSLFHDDIDAQMEIDRIAQRAEHKNMIFNRVWTGSRGEGKAIGGGLMDILEASKITEEKTFNYTGGSIKNYTEKTTDSIHVQRLSFLKKIELWLNPCKR